MKRIVKSSLLAFLLLPSGAFASVQITEIMYDPQGSDSGHEWIEITNNGTEPVDISTLRFFEANTNHKITPLSGGAVLPAGMSAAISANAATFAADWPAYSGVLLKSTFSLSNTGETLAIKNASSTLDMVSYTSAMGGGGNGGSLHRNGSDFIEAFPNLGEFPGNLRAVPKKVVSAPAKSAVSKSNVSALKTTQKSSVFSGSSTAAVYTSDSGSSAPMVTVFPALEWVLGLAALVILGIVAVFFVRADTLGPAFKETKAGLDEFEIVE